MTKGRAAEDAVLHRCNIYRANRLADIRQIPTSAKYVRKRDGDVGMVGLPSPPDFLGPMDPDGRLCAFDAKECKTDRYRHSKGQLHQLDWLWCWHQMGAAAFLLVLRGDRLWFILWPVPAWEHAESKAVTWKAVLSRDGIAVPCHGGYGLPDWLAVIADTESKR